MPNEEDLSRLIKRRRMVRGAGLGGIMVILLIVHVFWVPLDVLWFATLRRFGID
jgi:hypothetical protein